jgi:geranylgeranyl diphosphate synthase type II
MNSFESLSGLFAERFSRYRFPADPETLYAPNDYFLGLGGKRIRPVLCLMGNELFEEINEDAYAVATAIELFHNFTLIHDDIMDKAPLRRGMVTLHEKYGSSTALLAGDVMLVAAYECLSGISVSHLKSVMQVFNKTAREVCEGQEYDMDFESRASVKLEEYIHMIELKTSVLLAASLQMGAILGGAGESNQRKLYEFGRNLGIAFQVQDDYLDAFGDPEKFGKQVGGDILSNKKTFLLIKAMEAAQGDDALQLAELLQSSPSDKVERMLGIFRRCGVDEWAISLKDRYLDAAFACLDDIAVISARKQALRQLAAFLVKRDH